MDTDIKVKLDDFTKLEEKLEERIEEVLSGNDPAEELDRSAVDMVAGGTGSPSENSIIDDDPIVLPEI